MKKNILVTGATGNIGTYIIPQLIEGGANVRAIVRNATKAATIREMGAELFVGEFSNQESLDQAAD